MGKLNTAQRVYNGHYLKYMRVVRPVNAFEASLQRAGGFHA